MSRKTVIHQIYQACEKFKRAPSSVRLIAVSKRQSLAEVEKVILEGQRDFAESYLNEALPKIKMLTSYPLTWHFIGPIQSNKTRAIAENFSYVHSIERLKIAQRLNDQRPSHLPPLKVMLQVNIDNDPHKAGCTPDEVFELARATFTLSNLELIGLMTILTHQQNEQRQLESFKKLAALKEQLNLTLNINLQELSMGMTHDLGPAIAAGSTMVRIGSGIFSPKVS